MSRIRIRFAKLGKVRFTSHRDVARVWERVLHRAGWPVALTEGFSPRPKMHFGLALPTGAESLAEYLDVDLRDDEPGIPGPDLERAAVDLDPLLPPGITTTAVAAIERGTSLQQAVTSCQWELALPVDPADAAPSGRSLAQAVDAVLAAERLDIDQERKGRRQRADIRPGIIDLRVVPIDERVPRLAPGSSLPEVPVDILVAELATQPRALRPAELLQALGLAPDTARVCRLHQWILIDGGRREPLAAPSTTYAEARAS